MGLLNFFKRKKEKKAESNILLAMPLFKNNDRYDINDVCKHISSFWGLTVNNENGDNEAAVFHIDGQLVAIAHMPAPIPNEEVENVIPFNYLWENAKEELEGYTNHAIVTVMASDVPIVERYQLLTKMLYSIFATSNCVGVYEGRQTTLWSKELYMDMAKELKEGKLPINLWFYLGLRNGENNTMNAYTYGLKDFGHSEIEVIDSPITNEELYDFMLDIALYVIQNNVTLQDGETIGFTEEQKIKIRMSKGVFVDGDTIKLLI